MLPIYEMAKNKRAVTMTTESGKMMQ